MSRHAFERLSKLLVTHFAQLMEFFRVQKAVPAQRIHELTHVLVDYKGLPRVNAERFCQQIRETFPEGEIPRADYEERIGQQVGPVAPRLLQGGCSAPLGDPGMVPGEEHLRHRHAPEHRGPGVLRVLEQRLVVRVGGNIHPPAIVQRVLPVYPDVALQARLRAALRPLPSWHA